MSRIQASLQREAPAEHAVLQLVKRKAKPNNPQAVLDVIDKFAWNSQWLMNIGDHKGAILDAAIQQHQPKVAIEFGTYIGYSAIRIAQQLPSGGKLYSMDPDETHMQLARQIIDHAGVSHKVEVIQGTLQTSTEVLRSKGVQKVDFVFLDHVEH